MEYLNIWNSWNYYYIFVESQSSQRSQNMPLISRILGISKSMSWVYAFAGNNESSKVYSFSGISISKTSRGPPGSLRF